MKFDSKKYNRRFVISDIHGCFDTLKRLIAKIDLQKNDALFFLGDYIDKGPNPAEVLDFVIDLKKEFNVFTIRGNHEEDFLEMSQKYEPDFVLSYVTRRLRGEKLLTETGEIKEKYRDFFNQSQYFFELEDFILVHAGLNLSNKNIFEDKSSMLQRRFWDFSDLSLTNGKRVVNGHEPTSLDDIKKAVENKSNRIPLDNGCVYTQMHKHYDYTTLGHLCCLELNSWKLTCIKNEKDIVVKKRRVR